MMMETLPDRRSLKDHGPYSAYCRVCWNPVYSLWIGDEPPPGTCVLGKAVAHECSDAVGRALLSAAVSAAGSQATLEDEQEQDQPRTMCNRHGWWGIGPCPYCDATEKEEPEA